jgi:hypothetical protein
MCYDEVAFATARREHIGPISALPEVNCDRGHRRRYHTRWSDPPGRPGVAGKNSLCNAAADPGSAVHEWTGPCANAGSASTCLLLAH